MCYVTCAPTKLFYSQRVSAGWVVMSCCPPCCVPGPRAALSQPGPFPMAGCGWGDRAAAPGLTSAAAAGSIQPVPQQSPEASIETALLTRQHRAEGDGRACLPPGRRSHRSGTSSLAAFPHPVSVQAVSAPPGLCQ